MEVFCWNRKIPNPASTDSKKSTSGLMQRQATRAIPMRVVTVGKKRASGIQLVAEEYMDKIKHYCHVEDVHIRSNPKNAANVGAQIEAEDAMIMRQIQPDDWIYDLSNCLCTSQTSENFGICHVVMLDENGSDISSEQMSNLVEDAGLTGSSRISFCIGGPYGHGPKVRKRADVSIRLSSMVLNHQIAFIVLLEQLYRAWTILKGQKYHH